MPPPKSQAIETAHPGIKKMYSENFRVSLPISRKLCYTFHRSGSQRETAPHPERGRTGMKNLFNLDNPVFQVLTRLADLVVVNLITLACCIPVVTIGPALAALSRTVYDLTVERCGGTVKTYFRFFRSNFRQGMIAGIVSLLALGSLGCDFFLLKLYYQGGSYTALACLLLLLAFLTLGIISYLFPLIGRYDNTLRQHFQNALILLVRFLPRTAAMICIHLLPLFLFLFSPSVLLYTFPFWIFIGLGFFAQADAYLLKPVFEMLEAPKEEAAGEE